MQSASRFWKLRVQSGISSSEHLLVSWFPWEKCEKGRTRTLDTARERKKKMSLWLTFFVEPMHIFSCTFCALLGIRRESKLMFREPFVCLFVCLFCLFEMYEKCFKRSSNLTDTGKIAHGFTTFAGRKKKRLTGNDFQVDTKSWANFEFV